MDRQWTWQTCNEFGFFQSAGSEESPFHPLNSTLSVDYYLQQCKDAYKLPHPFTAVPTDFTNVRDIPYSCTRPPGALMASRARTVVLRGARAGRLACSPAGRLGGPVALARAGRAPDAAPAGPQPDAGLHRRCALAARGPGYGCSRGADRVATRQAPRTAATCTTRTPPTCPRCKPRTPRSRRPSPRGCPRARVSDRCLASAACRGWLVG